VLELPIIQFHIYYWTLFLLWS